MTNQSDGKREFHIEQAAGFFQSRTEEIYKSMISIKNEMARWKKALARGPNDPELQSMVPPAIVDEIYFRWHNRPPTDDERQTPIDDAAAAVDRWEQGTTWDVGAGMIPEAVTHVQRVSYYVPWKFLYQPENNGSEPLTYWNETVRRLKEKHPKRFPLETISWQCASDRLRAFELLAELFGKPAATTATPPAVPPITNAFIENKTGATALSASQNKAVKRAEWLATAMLLVKEHPDWSDAKIARSVSKDPGTLSRSKEYKVVARLARNTETNLPKGHIEVDKDAGTTNLEAIAPSTAKVDDGSDRGKQIPGSRLFYEYCAECKEPIRVAQDKVGKKPLCKHCAE